MTSGRGRAAPSPETPGIRERKRLRTRQTIRDAAFRLFAAEGFEAVTLTQIAEAADVSPGTVFLHFASKDEIFFQRDGLNARLPQVVAETESMSALIRSLRSYLDEVVETFLGKDAGEAAQIPAGILLGSPVLLSKSTPIVHKLTQDLARLLHARAAHLASNEDLELLAGFAMAIALTAWNYSLAQLAAGESVRNIRAALTGQLDHGFHRLSLAFPE